MDATDECLSWRGKHAGIVKLPAGMLQGEAGRGRERPLLHVLDP